MRSSIKSGLLVAALAATASAQEPRRLILPDSVPLELAAALISAGGFGDDPQILVGSLPEWVTNRIYIPGRARVLGSAFLGTTVVGVLTIQPASDTVIAEFKRELLARGWKNPPPPPTYGGGGFRPAPAAVPEGPATRLVLCGDQQIITASAGRRRGTATEVTVRISAAGNYSTCNPPQMGMTVPRSPFPTLINPPGASDSRMSGDCSATMSGSMGTGTTLRTSMTPEALLDHYGRQLGDSGWTSLSDKGTIVGRSWSRRDSTGAPIEVSLTVTTSTRDAGCRDLNLQVRTLRKP